MEMSHLLISVSSGGFRSVVLVADSADELLSILENNGYYFSQTVGRFIDDKDGKSSGVDYVLSVAAKYEIGMSRIPI